MVDEPQSPKSHDQSPIDANGPDNGRGPQSPTAAFDANVAARVWCRSCDMEIVPTGKGQCPRCGKMTRGNTARAKDPIDPKRVAYWTKRYAHRYRPRDAEMADLVEELAEIRAQIDAVRKGSQEWARLRTDFRATRAELKALRSENTIDTKDKLADLTVDQLEDRAKRLLRRVAELRGDAAMLNDPEAAAAVGISSTHPIVSSAPVVTNSDESSGQSVHLIPRQSDAPAPDPRCPYCNALESSCTEIRNDVRWLTEHQDRADVRAHLDAQAAIRSGLGWDASVARDPITRGRSTDDDPTAVMLRQIKFGNPY